MSQKICLLDVSLLVASSVVFGTPARGQQQQPATNRQATAPAAGVCGKTAPAANKICVSQPVEQQTQVSGQFTLAKALDAGAASPTVNITIPNANPAVSVAAQVTVKGTAGTFSYSGLHALSQYLTVEAEVTLPGGVTANTGDVPVTAAPKQAGGSSGLFTLGLFGINATASSSSGPHQQYFVDFDLLAPVRWLGKGCRGESDNTDPTTRTCWMWFSPRIASVPSASSTQLSSLSSSSSLTTALNSQTIGQISQSFESQGGFEYYILKPNTQNFWDWGAIG